MTGRSAVDTMMALRAHARGGPEQLVYEQAPAPVPGPGEALVAVHAAAITFAELTWDLSWTTKDGRDRTPVIPSHEMSGTIAGIADSVTGVAVGDEVCGLIEFDRNGAAADYVTVPAAELAARPRSISHAETATLPLAALTAWQALVDHAAVESGEHVLVTGGAGGVGAFAVQLATVLGASVSATGRPADAGYVRSLGAQAFIGSDGARTEKVSGLDVIVDTVGGAALDAAYGMLRPGGRLVTLGAPPSQERARSFGVHAMFFVVSPDPAGLARLAELVDGGQLPAPRRPPGLRKRHTATSAGQDGPDRPLIPAQVRSRCAVSRRSSVLELMPSFGNIHSILWPADHEQGLSPHLR
jgi:NADPH:quinone reductase-like Zn-dependent oxidoreductase